MKKGKMIWVVSALMLLAGLSSACGKQDYTVEYGVDGYIWPARKIQGMDGTEDIRLTGEYLYYIQNTGSGRAVGRILVSDMLTEGNGVLDFSGQEILFTESNKMLELPEDAGEEVDFAALMESGSAVSWGGIDPEKEYAVFSLAEYDADEEGNLYYSMNVRKGPYLEMEAAGSVLCMRTKDGREAYRLWMPDIAGLAAGGNGRVFALTEDGILILDQDGSQVGQIGPEEYQGSENETAEDLFRDAEGRIYCITSVRQDSRFLRKTYEIKEKKGFHLEDAEDFLGKGDMQYSPSSDGNIFLFKSDNVGNLYEYDRKSGTRNKVLNLWDSGLSGFGLEAVARLSPDVLLVCYSYEGVFQLTRTSVETLPERELLIIASPMASEQLRQAVIQFNARSTEYRIVIDDYGAAFETEGWVSPYLDASLVSSNPPDMVDLGLLNIAKYGEKGVLEDLAPYIERSADLDLGDIPENVLEGLTFHNKLVCLPTTLQVQCVAARMQQTAGLESWSMEDVYRLSELYPESTGELVSDGFGGRMERSWLLEEFCARYYLERFVDWEEGSCSFAQEEFYRLLQWVEKYGAEPEKEQLAGGSVYSEFEHVPDNVMLLSRSFLNFESLAYLELQFDGEVRLMGYPTVDGKGCFPAKVDEGLGIAANSAHKEAAWEFLELYRQREVGGGQLPVSKSKIAESYEYLTTEEFLGNGVNGEPKWKEKAYIGLDGELTALYAIEKEQADAVMAAVETADFSPLTEEEEAVIRIVAEEAESYFNGDKSPEEAAKVIQNRVQLLLNER